MTMRTYTHYICPNGHQGYERLSENDQPYSKDWESITTEGLGEVTGTDGNSYYICAVCRERMSVTDKPKP